MTDTTETAETRGAYVGPTAARIADLLSRETRVRFQQGWYWTEAGCHDSIGDLAAFRQRPDGDGIDVRCRSAGCSRLRIIRWLEQRTGELIWSAYAAEFDETPMAKPPKDAPPRINWRLVGLALVTIVLVAPLILGYGPELAALNLIGFGWIAWLACRFRLDRADAAMRARRRR